MPLFTHIFRTELNSDEGYQQLSMALNSNPKVYRWHVDLEDVDKVLKVETETLTEECIIALALSQQIHCEVLPD